MQLSREIRQVRDGVFVSCCSRIELAKVTAGMPRSIVLLDEGWRLGAVRSSYDSGIQHGLESCFCLGEFVWRESHSLGEDRRAGGRNWQRDAVFDGVVGKSWPDQLRVVPPQPGDVRILWLHSEIVGIALEETQERDEAEPVSAWMSLWHLTSTRSPEWRRKSAPINGRDTFAKMNLHMWHVPATTKEMALWPKITSGSALDPREGCKGC